MSKICKNLEFLLDRSERFEIKERLLFVYSIQLGHYKGWQIGNGSQGIQAKKDPC